MRRKARDCYRQAGCGRWRSEFGSNATGRMFVSALLFAQCLSNSQAAEHSRSIFRCKAADVTIFSDRPCDQNAEVYSSMSASAANIAEPFQSTRPQSTAAIDKPKAKPKPTAAAESDVRDKQKLAARCDRIQQSLRDIRSKMRAGYNAKEGNRLHERQSKLEEERRSAKCV